MVTYPQFVAAMAVTWCRLCFRTQKIEEKPTTKQTTLKQNKTPMVQPCHVPQREITTSAGRALAGRALRRHFNPSPHGHLTFWIYRAPKNPDIYLYIHVLLWFFVAFPPQKMKDCCPSSNLWTVCSLEKHGFPSISPHVSPWKSSKTNNIYPKFMFISARQGLEIMFFMFFMFFHFDHHFFGLKIIIPFNPR